MLKTQPENKLFIKEVKRRKDEDKSLNWSVES